MSVRISGDNITVDGQTSIAGSPTSLHHALRNSDVTRRRAYVSSLNLNSSAPSDLDAITVPSTKWVATRLLACNCTADLHLATLGLYTAAAAGGTAIAAPQSLTDLTASGKFFAMTLAALTSHLTAVTIYPRLTVASGVAGTITLILEFEDISLV
jgi:hypothetical protein